MSERIPLYDRPIVSKFNLEREQEVRRAAGVLADEYGMSKEDWFQVRDEMVKKGVPQFSADQSIIDMGRKKAEKPDMRETHVMAPVSVSEEEPEKKIATTQEAPIPGSKIIQFRPSAKSSLSRRLAETTTQASVAKK